MPAVVTPRALMEVIRKSGLLHGDQLAELVKKLCRGNTPPKSARELAAALVQAGSLTPFQARKLLQGKWRGFFIRRKYQVRDLLGMGGAARVYLCQHVALQRLVALKFLPLKAQADQYITDRFYREARAVAALNHPNIVRVFDIDQAEQHHFMVLEYVPGPNLHQLVQQDGHLHTVQAADYIRQAAAALQHAYEAGWIHRDIKPSNLLLDPSGTVKMLDLGLARMLDDQQASLSLIHGRAANALMGTVDFMSPEQALDSSNVDIRSDVYSLGVTLRFLLCGRSQFDSDLPLASKLLALQLEEPTPLRNWRPDVPPRLEAIVAKMMARHPAQRYQTPQEVIDALTAWLDEVHSSERPTMNFNDVPTQHLGDRDPAAWESVDETDFVTGSGFGEGSSTGSTADELSWMGLSNDPSSLGDDRSASPSLADIGTLGGSADETNPGLRPCPPIVTPEDVPGRTAEASDAEGDALAEDRKLGEGNALAQAGEQRTWHLLALACSGWVVAIGLSVVLGLVAWLRPM